MQQADCNRSIWIVGAIAGLMVMLFASGLGQTDWPGGLFLGVMTCLLGGGLLIWLLMMGRQAPFDARLPQPPARQGGMPQAVAEPVGAGAPQDLTAIRGIGPSTQIALHAEGITRLQQLAHWDEAAVRDFSARLGRLGARIAADDWPGQARALLAGRGAADG